MPRSLIQHETIAPELDGFIRILSNVTRRALGLEEPPRYVVYQVRDRDGLTQFWATVSINGRALAQEHSYRFVGRVMAGEYQAIQYAAREAIAQLRHQVLRTHNRSFFYYPSRSSSDRGMHIANSEHEQNPALENLVHFVAAQESLLTQVARELSSTRRAIAQYPLVRGSAEPSVILSVVPESNSRIPGDNQRNGPSLSSGYSRRVFEEYIARTRAGTSHPEPHQRCRCSILVSSLAKSNVEAQARNHSPPGPSPPSNHVD